MSVSELRNRSREELARTLSELLQEQFKLRLSKATGQLVRTHRLGIVRREIARIRTVLAQKGE